MCCDVRISQASPLQSHARAAVGSLSKGPWGLRELIAACLTSRQFSANIRECVYFLEDKIYHEFILIPIDFSNFNLK